MGASKNILLTGGRSPTALFLARELSRTGHRVLMAETTRWHVCRFSNAITKNFVVPSPRYETEAFIQAIRDIVHREEIDLILPTYEEILYLSKAADKFPPHVFEFIPPFVQLNRLHNKWLFHNHLRMLGLTSPPTYLISALEEIPRLPFTQPFALKACYSRASQEVLRVVPGEPLPKLQIEAHNPWVAQEWIQGKKFCTYSVARQGKLVAHATYPMEYSIEGNSCLVFEAREQPQVLDWIEEFVAKESYTGQIAFDFILSEEGVLYPIECNPRATSGLYLFLGQEGLDRVFVDPPETLSLLQARPGTTQQFAAGMFLYGWRNAVQEKKFLSYLKTLFSVRDVIFSRQDIKPFIYQPMVMFQYILLGYRTHRKVFAVFTHDCDWNNESTQNLR